MSDPAGAAEIITRMCEPERSERYATLAEVPEDLAICEIISQPTAAPVAELWRSASLT